MESLYDSPRLAAGYAFHRPPVHQAITERMKEHLPQRLRRALDIGCGAGLSAAALEPLVDFVVGLEPVEKMLAHRALVSTRVHFIVAKAEALPFAAQSFDLLTAAGALNYADLSLFFPEAKRVLTRDGVLAIYDFSEGRRWANDNRLDDWYERFQQRYPSPPGYALDVENLDYERYGFQLQKYHPIEAAVPMTLSSYLRYALSETSVELAISQGASEIEISDWCRATLTEIFDETPREVLFDAYVAYVTKRLA